MTALTIPTPEQGKAAWKERKADPALKQPTLTKGQLVWCRKFIPGFAHMEAQARASKLVASK